jgi:hypothetical protein
MGRPVCSCPIQGARNTALPSVFRATETGDVCLSVDRCRIWRDLGAAKSTNRAFPDASYLHNRPRGNRRFVPNAAGWFPFCKNQPVSSAGRSKLIRGGVGRNLLNGGQIQRNTHSPPSPVPIPTRRRPVPVGCHRAGCLIDVDLGCGDWWGLGIACPGFPLLSQFQLQRRDLLLRLVGSQLGLAVFMLETLMLLSKPCQFSA